MSQVSTPQQSQTQSQQVQKIGKSTVTLANVTSTQPGKSAIVVANTGQIVQGAQVFIYMFNFNLF